MTYNGKQFTPHVIQWVTEKNSGESTAGNTTYTNGCASGNTKHSAWYSLTNATNTPPVTHWVPQRTPNGVYWSVQPTPHVSLGDTPHTTCYTLGGTNHTTWWTIYNTTNTTKHETRYLSRGGY